MITGGQAVRAAWVWSFCFRRPDAYGEVQDAIRDEVDLGVCRGSDGLGRGQH